MLSRAYTVYRVDKMVIERVFEHFVILLLVSTPRINTLSDWSLRRGAPTKKNWGWGMGAPRLSDQSDRVFILGVETSTRACSTWQLDYAELTCVRHFSRARNKVQWYFHCNLFRGRGARRRLAACRVFPTPGWRRYLEGWEAVATFGAADQT
jgi:hypothetical protein